jgi:hypothetical protein
MSVTVTLDQLIAHNDTHMRFDGVVITEGADGLPVYRCTTVRLDELGGHDMLCYSGPARRHLDIAWWISLNDKGVSALADLVRDMIDPADFGTAAADRAAQSSAQPDAAAAATAVDTTAMIVNAVGAALPASIPLFRTTFLAGAAFGLGRHPAADSVRVGDISFAYRIAEG